MVSFASVITPDLAETVRAYVVGRANDDWHPLPPRRGATAPAANKSAKRRPTCGCRCQAPGRAVPAAGRPCYEPLPAAPARLLHTEAAATTPAATKSGHTVPRRAAARGPRTKCSSSVKPLKHSQGSSADSGGPMGRAPQSESSSHNTHRDGTLDTVADMLRACGENAFDTREAQRRNHSQASRALGPAFADRRRASRARAHHRSRFHRGASLCATAAIQRRTSPVRSALRDFRSHDLARSSTTSNARCSRMVKAMRT